MRRYKVVFKNTYDDFLTHQEAENYASRFSEDEDSTYVIEEYEVEE